MCTSLCSCTCAITVAHPAILTADTVGQETTGTADANVHALATCVASLSTGSLVVPANTNTVPLERSVTVIRSSSAAAAGGASAAGGAGSDAAASGDASASLSSRIPALPKKTEEYTRTSSEVRSDLSPPMLSRSLMYPAPDTLELLRVLYKNHKDGLLSFNDYDQVEIHAREHLIKMGPLPENARDLILAAMQFAEFQNLTTTLSKTIDSLKETEQDIYRKLVAVMNNRFDHLDDATKTQINALRANDAIEVYRWTIDQIISFHVPQTDYIKVYRVVTNYINCRTHGSDWPVEDKIVMKALSDAFGTREIAVRDPDAEKVSAAVDLWIEQCFTKHEISPDSRDRIKTRVNDYVQRFRRHYLSLLYGSITNYITSRTQGSDWSNEDKTVMEALSDSLKAKEIDISDPDEKKVSAAVDLWLEQYFTNHRITPDSRDRIKAIVSDYVQGFRKHHLTLSV